MPVFVGLAMLICQAFSDSVAATQPVSATQPTATGFLHKTLTLDGQTYAYGVFVFADGAA